jgi:hypothetical protein
MVDISGGIFGSLGGIAMQWVSSGIFWAIASFCGIVAAYMGLLFRKKRKLIVPVIMMYEGEDGINRYVNMKGGWFRHKITLFGLWDYGKEKIFRLKNNTPIADLSQEDYRMIDGKMGVVLVTVAHDTKFAVPISKIHLTADTKNAMAQIAPVDLRNAAMASIEEVEDEMKNKWDKILPYLTMGFIGLIIIFSIIMITQYGKHNVDVAATMLRKSKAACGQAIASLAP